MGAKIKNHTVTRGYLAGWKHIDQRGHVGLWYFDVIARDVKYAESLNAAFAITKAIYTPKIDGRRDDRLENWFASSESEMCDFIRDFRWGSKRRWKPSAIKKAISAIVALGYRGEHALRSIRQKIAEDNPETTPEDVTIAALNNLYNVAQDRIRFFLRGTALLLDWSAPILMTNDAPFWDLTPRSPNEPFGLFPLSPTRLLVLLPDRRPIAGDMQIIQRSGEEFRDILSFARSGAIRSARRWVVCASEAEANDVGVYLTKEVWNEVTSTDKFRFINTETNQRIFGT